MLKYSIALAFAVFSLGVSSPAIAEDSSGGVNSFFSAFTAPAYSASINLVDETGSSTIELTEPIYIEEALAQNGYKYSSYSHKSNKNLSPLTILGNKENVILVLKKYENSIKVVELKPTVQYVKSEFLEAGEKNVMDEGTPGKAFITSITNNRGVTTQTTTVITPPVPQKIIIGTGNASLPENIKIEDLLALNINYPIANVPVTSDYGYRLHPTLHVWKLHDGVDFGAGCGTPIHPAAPGKVISAKYETGYGNRVLIDHGAGFVTGYAHLSAFNVEVGDFITPKDTLGLVGTTGYSTGCHLHFMTLLNDESFDPLLLLEQ